MRTFASSSLSPAGLPPMASGTILPVEAARHLLEMRKTGILSTVSFGTEASGLSAPLFASRVSYVPRHESRDLLLGLPQSSPHVAHLQVYSQASLLVFPLLPAAHNPAEFPNAPKLNVTGGVTEVLEEQRAAALHDLKSRHRVNQRLVDSIRLFSLSLESIAYSDGTNQQQPLFLEPEDLWNASTDPLAPAAPHIIEEINLQRFEDKLIAAVMYYSDRPERPRAAFLFNLDRYGFDVMVEDSSETWDRLRMPFPIPIADPDLALKAVHEGLDEAAAAHLEKYGPPKKDEESQEEPI